MRLLTKNLKIMFATICLVVVLGFVAYLFTGMWNTHGLGVGDQAEDFTLKDIHGIEYTLSQLVKQKPVVLVFGSFT